MPILARATFVAAAALAVCGLANAQFQERNVRASI